MKKEKISNRKELMIFLLNFLSKKNEPIRMDQFFFETEYTKGLDSFREVLEEMARLQWVNIIDEPGKVALGFIQTRDIRYTISLKGIEYLAELNTPKKKHPKNYHIKEIIIGIIITVVGGILLNIIPNLKGFFTLQKPEIRYQKPYISIKNYKLKAVNDTARNLDTIIINFRYQGSKIKLNRNFKLIEYNFENQYYFHLGDQNEFKPELELIEVTIDTPIIDSINQVSNIKLELKRRLIFSGFKTAYFNENDKEKIGDLKISFSYEYENQIFNDTLVSYIYIIK